MTLAEARRSVSAILETVLSPVRFHRASALVFRREAGGAVEVLAFPLREDGRGFFAVGCNVGVRFERVEEVLDAEHADRTTPTVMVPLHVLEPGSRFNEWMFSSERDAEDLPSDIDSRLRRLALPWLDRYSRVGDLRSSLEADGPLEDLVVTPERRVCLIAAIDVVEGRRDAAIRRLEEALRERASALPKTRFAIEELRERLLARDRPPS